MAIRTYNDEYMWANVMEQANDQWLFGQFTPSGRWAYPVSPPAGVATPAFDSNGYPIGLGGLAAQGYFIYTYVFTNGAAYPAGTYTLTFDGKGTVEICDGTQTRQTFSQTGGMGSPFNVNIVNDTDGIVVAITNSNPRDYVRNIRPGHAGLQKTVPDQPVQSSVPECARAFRHDPIHQCACCRTMVLRPCARRSKWYRLPWAERTPPPILPRPPLPA